MEKEKKSCHNYRLKSNILPFSTGIHFFYFFYKNSQEEITSYANRFFMLKQIITTEMEPLKEFFLSISLRYNCCMI